jgi:hypothetical protein
MVSDAVLGNCRVRKNWHGRRRRDSKKRAKNKEEADLSNAWADFDDSKRVGKLFKR